MSLLSVDANFILIMLRNKVSVKAKAIKDLFVNYLLTRLMSDTFAVGWIGTIDEQFYCILIVSIVGDDYFCDYTNSSVFHYDQSGALRATLAPLYKWATNLQRLWYRPTCCSGHWFDFLMHVFPHFLTPTFPVSLQLSYKDHLGLFSFLFFCNNSGQ